MACFLAPLAGGIITSAISRFFKGKWNLHWLNMMFWGASAMLAVEHVAHGEVVFYPPFLTRGLSQVAPEIMAIGGAMAAVSVGIWTAMNIALFMLSKDMKEPLQKVCGACK